MSKDLIIKRMKIIHELEEELNKLKTHYDETLENDAQYQKIQEEVTKVKSENHEKQERLLSNPSYKAIQDQIKEKRQEVKETKEILSMELVDLYRESGLPEVEDEEGNIKKMKFTVKLVD